MIRNFLRHLSFSASKPGRYKEILSKLNFIFALGFVFFLPLGKDFILYFIWLIGLTWLLEGRYKELVKRMRILDRKTLFFCILMFFYLIHIVGLLYSNNLKAGLFDVQVKLSLLLFPLFLFTANERYSKNLNHLLLAFVAGTVFSAIICYFAALFHISHFENGIVIFDLYPPDEYHLSWFSYKYFSIFHHPSYFAMYVLLSISILMYFISEKHYFGKLKKTIYIVAIIFLSITLFFISSRAGIITFVAILLFYFLREILWKILIVRTWLNIFPLILLLCMFAFLVLNGKRFQTIQQELSSRYQVQEGTVIGSAGLRLIIWEETINLIKKNVLFGVGTGDIKDELHMKSKQNSMDQVAEMDLNVHNQYMETFLGLGILGILTLLAFILLPFLYQPIANHYVLPFFFIIISINFFFESVLNRLAGVAFFSFFYCLLIFSYPSEKND